MSDWNKINFVNCFWKPWYFLHVENALKSGAFSEYIPIRHYHHRFTRSIFWELRDLIPFANHPLYRYLLGWLGAPKVSLLKKTMSPQIRKEVFYKHAVQDIIIPIDKMQESLNKFHDWFEIYPLLIFPIAVFKHNVEGMMRNPSKLIYGKDYQMYFDLGVYGIPEKVRQGRFWDAEKVIHEMEEYTRNVGGYQCLYADTLMTCEEFQKMLNHDTYDKLRKQYNCIGAFPTVYEKIQPEKNLLH
jgi:delta24-sterol reductase